MVATDIGHEPGPVDLYAPRYTPMPAPKGRPPAMSESVTKVLGELIAADTNAATDDDKWRCCTQIARSVHLSDTAVNNRLTEMTACEWLERAKRDATGERGVRVYRVTDAGRAHAADHRIEGER